MLAFVGLHPLLAVSVVNGGHPDALIALGVFTVVFLALSSSERSRGLRARVRRGDQLHVIVGALAVGVWAFHRWTQARGR